MVVLQHVRISSCPNFTTFAPATASAAGLAVTGELAWASCVWWLRDAAAQSGCSACAERMQSGIGTFAMLKVLVVEAVAHAGVICCS